MADVELGRWKEPHGARCGRENLSLPRDDVVVDVDASRSRRTETIVFLELISRSSAFDPPTFSSALASSTRSSWKRYDFPRSFLFSFLFSFSSLSLLSRVSRYETFARNERCNLCFEIVSKSVESSGEKKFSCEGNERCDSINIFIKSTNQTIRFSTKAYFSLLISYASRIRKRLQINFTRFND